MKPSEDSENQSRRLGKAGLTEPKLPRVTQCSIQPRSEVSGIEVWTNQNLCGFLGNYILRVTQESLDSAHRLKNIFLCFTGDYLPLNS